MTILGMNAQSKNVKNHPPHPWSWVGIIIIFSSEEAPSPSRTDNCCINVLLSVLTVVLTKFIWPCRVAVLPSSHTYSGSLSIMFPKRPYELVLSLLLQAMNLVDTKLFACWSCRQQKHQINPMHWHPAKQARVTWLFWEWRLKARMLKPSHPALGLGLG